MGWMVLAKGTVDFPKGTPKELVEQVFEKMENKKVLKETVFYNQFYNLKKFYSKKSGGEIYFEMSGYKVINYDPLDEIKNFILKKLKGKNLIGLTICANEFCEQDSGFYYEYEENEE